MGFYGVPLIIRSKQPHGRAFKIIKRDDLISRVIPKYFVCAKYGA